MELFFFRHAEFEKLYNCTGLDSDSVPWERRQFVPESIILGVLCTIYYILYVPCMFSIWKHMRDNSCYKLLFYIGVTDLGILWILGFFSAWLNLRGAVFCSNPKLIYFVGSFLYLWFAESSADLVLALNRCIDLISPRFAHILFAGHRTSLWIIACSLYALYWMVFFNPAVFSSIHFAWFFNPFVGYRNDHKELYEHWLHGVHNYAVSVLFPFIYLIFAVKLIYDARKNGRQLGFEMSALQLRQWREDFSKWITVVELFELLYCYLVEVGKSLRALSRMCSFASLI